MAIRIVTTSSVLSNIDQFVADREILSAPCFDLADALAFVNDGGEFEDYPGGNWSDPDGLPFEPSPSDWSEYAAWSREQDGGCGVTELTPDEKALIAHSLGDLEFINARIAEAECLGLAGYELS